MAPGQEELLVPRWSMPVFRLQSELPCLVPGVPLNVYVPAVRLVASSTMKFTGWPVLGQVAELHPNEGIAYVVLFRHC